jgi:hypothetical protein
MEHNLIDPGPPRLSTLLRNEDMGIETRALCLIDGYAAEIYHVINTRRQEYNLHTIRVFDPDMMSWSKILSWDYTAVGHVPTYPDGDTFAHLTALSRQMWEQANIIAAQSRMRRAELERIQYVAKKIALEEAYVAQQVAEAESRPTYTPGPGDVAEDDEPPYTGTAPEEQG